jgi:signal transduction histidine kinase/ActR/RegA family two-component response regulator
MLLAWAAIVLMVALGQWLFTQKFFKAKHVSNAEVWAKKLSLFTFALAVLVGGSTWLFYDPQNLMQTFLLAVLIIGSMFGSIIFAASYFPIHAAWSVPLTLPFSSVLLTGSIEQIILGMLFIFVGMPVTLLLGWMMSKEYAASLQLRFEKDALLKDLQAQKDEADKANRDKTQFLAAASHDLRQPHQALGLFVEALDHMETEPRKKEILDKTKQAFKAMSSLLDQLLDISKLDSAAVHADKQNTLLQPLLHQVVMEHMGEAEKKGIELRLRVSKEAVFTDASMLTRIVSNLVTNAIRYTQQGGVLVATRWQGGKLWLNVWDTGCGIPEDKQAYIFKEFTQLENPERDREKGLGLGLAIVQRLVHILEVDFKVNSRENQGSCFSLELEPVAKEAVITKTRQIIRKIDLQGLKVLVIDDDKIALESVQTLLDVWGCEVHVFPDLASGLAYLQSSKLCPDFMIADYRLRHYQTGLSAIEAVRAFCNQQVPALIVTGDTNPELIAEVEAKDIPLLHKPLNPQALKQFLIQAKADRL